ncbi:hypothetical protein Ahy_A09g045238 isoform B [Arachis hypogaea]|uniref:Uncharacterized protein n=1 Tax=Arachis hypogaea TaxID=3818 RepID=A0A445BLW8_ARAHY|nr:hypothetical protein Ahy_A09g045238 isoform B [Arachis hypogaea]
MAPISMKNLGPLERIVEIEQHDEFSRLLSQNDSVAHAFGKEHPGRVRGVGFRPISSQLFERWSLKRGDSNELTAKKLKRKVVEEEVAAEKTKRQVVENEVAVEKIKMHAIESAQRCLIQRHGGKLPLDIAAWMNSLEGQSGK